MLPKTKQKNGMRLYSKVKNHSLIATLPQLTNKQKAPQSHSIQKMDQSFPTQSVYPSTPIIMMQNCRVVL